MSGPGIDVSIVIPTRDRAGVVGDAVTCALEQEGVSVEVIVVDDGSRDATSEVLGSLAQSRLRVINMERPQGVARARNRGAAEARGSWLAFLDDDDLWAPRWLRSALDACRADDATFVYGGRVVVDADRRPLQAQLPERPDCVRAGLKRQNVVGGPSVVVMLADLFRAAGPFDERLHALADWELWTRLLRIGTPVAVPDMLVAYTLHAGNMHIRSPAAILREVDQLAALGIGDRTSVLRWLATDSQRFGRPGQAAWLFLRAAWASRGFSDVGRAAFALQARKQPWPGPDWNPLEPAWLSRWTRAVP